MSQSAVALLRFLYRWPGHRRRRQLRAFDNAQTTIFLVVTKGLRPDVDFATVENGYVNGDRKLMDLAKWCWDQQPNNRPNFTHILMELEKIWEECGHDGVKE